MKILQLFTSGYLPSRDAIFAYGMYDPNLNKWQIKIGNDLTTWEQEILQLKDFLIKAQEHDSPIQMFNGRTQLNFLKSYKIDVESIYRNHIIDVYQEIKKLREIVNLPNLQLQTIAREIDSNLTLLSPPTIYKMWEENADSVQEELFKNHLIGIYHAAHYLKQLKKSMSRSNFSIDHFIQNTFYGSTSHHESLYIHSNYYLYEENLGKFKLEVYPQEIAYDSRRHCTYIPVEKNFSNLVAMPEGFLLIRLDNTLNIQGILDLIQSIHNLR